MEGTGRASGTLGVGRIGRQAGRAAGSRIDALHRTKEARPAIRPMWPGTPRRYRVAMAAWWRRRPPVVQDLLAGGAVAVTWFTAFYLLRQRGWSPREPETFVVAGLWTAGTLALRRVHPAWVLAVVVVAYPISYGATLQTEFHLLPVLVAGYTATSTGRVHPVMASVGCMAANLVLSWNDRAAPGGLGPPLGGLGGALGDRPFDWPSVLFIELATVSVVVLGWLMHREAAISGDLAQRNVELERLRAVEVQRVVAEERTRVARELHDVVAHHLTAVVIRAQAADRVRATRPEVASESVGWIAETAKEALTAMRTTVRVLRTDGDAAALAPEPTLGELRAVAARVGQAGLDIELRLPEPLPDLEPQVELAAVRIAQEALTNAMRHAAARRAVVTLRCEADGVVVDINDDGTNGPPSARRRDGTGLIGMQERAAACGGRLRIDSGPLGGWRIRAWLPARAAWS
jgi:signal transduction histidine kinase